MRSEILEPLLNLVLLQSGNAPLTDSVEAHVRGVLRADVGPIILGVIISALGLAAIVIHFYRRQPNERLLLWFGLFASLYGVRLLTFTTTVRFVADAPPEVWGYIDSLIGYVIVIPALLFAEELYGKGWRSSLRWSAWILALYAAIAVVVDFVARSPFAAPDPALVLMFPLLAVVFLAGWWSGYRPPPIAGNWVLLIGFITFIVGIIHEHLVNANLLPWNVRIEPIAFLALTCCLGYIAARRFFVNERQVLELTQEMEDARRIQASILPQQMPGTTGLKIAAKYVPMTAVAGDFYDFLTMDGGRGLGVLVADVSGHGVAAALVASMVKVAISAQAANAFDPGAVVAGLNQILCKQLRGPLVSAGYLYLDLEKRRGLYAGAGHPPLLLWRGATGALRELEENGLIIGVLSNQTYRCLEFELGAGDRILMYTDGILEASNPEGEFFGDVRFREFIAEHRGLEPDQFASRLLTELSSWTGKNGAATQSDDITLLVIDVNI